jgi:phospholipid/cholesterol/gamma-HCH transport system substrate-binding protein
MADQAKNILIGVFVISAISIITFMLLFLHPSVGDESQLLRVRFSDIDKVNVGTRVTFAGKPVGEVIEIRELDSARNERIARNGVVFVYELELAVDSGVNVYNSDAITLRTSGLLGERSIEINPQPPKPGQKLRLVNNEIIYAEETGSVENTFKEFKEVADRFDVALDALTENLNEITKQRIWKKVGNITQNVSDITTALNIPEDWSSTLANVRELSEEGLGVMDKLDVTLDEAQTTFRDIQDTFREARLTFENATVITEGGKQVMLDIREGKGTAGKILVGDEVYLKLNSLLSKGGTIMNDINHYGLLFHLDKGWQRMRARRMNLLNKLRSPQEFSNFFNDELDRINTSLSRVGMILEKTDQCYPMECLLRDREFTQVFSELLDRIETLEEEIKMYNEQLVDTAKDCGVIRPGHCCYPG